MQNTPNSVYSNFIKFFKNEKKKDGSIRFTSCKFLR